jgi:hypothetical protein
MYQYFIQFNSFRATKALYSYRLLVYTIQIRSCMTHRSVFTLLNRPAMFNELNRLPQNKRSADIHRAMQSTHLVAKSSTENMIYLMMLRKLEARVSNPDKACCLVAPLSCAQPGPPSRAWHQLFAPSRRSASDGLPTGPTPRWPPSHGHSPGHCQPPHQRFVMCAASGGRRRGAGGGRARGGRAGSCLRPELPLPCSVGGALLPTSNAQLPASAPCQWLQVAGRQERLVAWPMSTGPSDGRHTGRRQRRRAVPRRGSRQRRRGAVEGIAVAARCRRAARRTAPGGGDRRVRRLGLRVEDRGSNQQHSESSSRHGETPPRRAVGAP